MPAPRTMGVDVCRLLWTHVFFFGTPKSRRYAAAVDALILADRALATNSDLSCATPEIRDATNARAVGVVRDNV